MLNRELRADDEDGEGERVAQPPRGRATARSAPSASSATPPPRAYGATARVAVCWSACGNVGTLGSATPPIFTGGGAGGNGSSSEAAPRTRGDALRRDARRLLRRRAQPLRRRRVNLARAQQPVDDGRRLAHAVLPFEDGLLRELVRHRRRAPHALAAELERLLAEEAADLAHLARHPRRAVGRDAVELEAAADRLEHGLAHDRRRRTDGRANGRRRRVGARARRALGLGQRIVEGARNCATNVQIGDVRAKLARDSESSPSTLHDGVAARSRGRVARKCGHHVASIQRVGRRGAERRAIPHSLAISGGRRAGSAAPTRRRLSFQVPAPARG